MRVLFLLLHTYSMYNHVHTRTRWDHCQPDPMMFTQDPNRKSQYIMIFGFQIETNRLLLDWCTLAVFSRYIGILSLVQLSRAEPTDSLMAKERLLAYCFCKGGWEIPENLTLISVNPC